MKILFVHALSDPAVGGGAEETLWTLMRALVRAGHECVLIAGSDQPGLEREVIDGVVVWRAGLRNLYWPYRRTRPGALVRAAWHLVDIYNPLMQGYLRRIVRVEAPDVASVHNLPGWSAATWRTLAQCKVPVVQVLHDYYAICVKASMYRDGRNCANQCRTCALSRLPHRTLSRSVSAVVGVSRYVLDRHVSLGYFVGVQALEVVHNARDRDKLGVGSGATDGVGPTVGSRSGVHPMRVGYIGRLDLTKGIELLIEAFIGADLGEAELLIAGTGQAGYEDALKVRYCHERVRFLGRVRPQDFFPGVDVIVVPSIWNEPLGMVIGESYVFGKPVIASRRGGIPELVEDGKSGLLFDPDHPDELISALRRVASDERFMRSAALAARKRGDALLDIGAWISRYVEIYARAQATSGSVEVVS